MKISLTGPVLIALAGFAMQTAYAGEGDSKLIGPMFKPIRIENPSAADQIKGRTLQDRGLTDGIVGPAMRPPISEKEKSGGNDKKGESRAKKNG